MARTTRHAPPAAPAAPLRGAGGRQTPAPRPARGPRQCDVPRRGAALAYDVGGVRAIEKRLEYLGDIPLLAHLVEGGRGAARGRPRRAARFEDLPRFPALEYPCPPGPEAVESVLGGVESYSTALDIGGDGIPPHLARPLGVLPGLPRDVIGEGKSAV